MSIKELRKEVVFYGQQLLKQGLTMHAGGNVSARDRETGLVAIKPSTMPYDLIKPEDVPVIDLDGNIVEVGSKPSSEWPMHTAIYKAFPRVCGIVHCHSIYATAFSVANVEIPLISHELSVYCSGPVRVAPFENPGSEGLALSAVKHLGQGNCAVLLQNHGSLAMGATLWHAFDCACAIEQAAHMKIVAQQLGGALEVPKHGRDYLRAIDPLAGPDTGKAEIKAV